MAETRVQTVRDLAASRFDWEQALRDSRGAIPPDVTLTSLNGDISSGSGGGGSASAARSPPRRSRCPAARPARSRSPA